jgi:3-oxoacyl-[acyl-carrier protein] reductase
MKLGIEGRAAIVTGGGSGIGAEVVRLLAEEGAHVAIVDLDGAKAVAKANAMSATGCSAIAVQADVTNAASVEEMITQVTHHFGALHILVNNAGFTRDARITAMTEEAWDAVIDVTLKGAFLCAKAAMPHLKKHGHGRIINISSRAHLGNPGQTNYSSAKAGLIGFTRALALEGGLSFITVNAVAPGLIDTEMVRALFNYEKVREKAEKGTPIPRIGTASDVANAVVFLSSDKASYITGEVVHVTGGRY